MSGRKVILRYASPLHEERHAAPDAAKRCTHDLPASFPLAILDDDQIEAVAAWFDEWQADTMERIRAALNLPTDADGREGIRKSIPELVAACVVLCHLLCLHPAAEHSLPTLARALGVRERKLYYIRDAIMSALSGALPSVKRKTPRPKQMAALFPQLDFSRCIGKRPCMIVPFAHRTTLAEQWETVISLASYPRITATLALTPADENAVRITFAAHV